MTRAQQTVLYTLAALVCLTVLAILLANLGVFGETAQKSQLATWGPAGALAEIIALFAFVSKTAFKSKLSLVIGPLQRPENLRSFDINRIEWIQQECFVVDGQNNQQRITLVADFAGRGGFRVQLPDGVFDKEDALQLSLKDAKGNRWRAGPFLPFERVVPLSLVEPAAKVIADYADEEQ